MTAVWARALLYLLVVGGGWLVALPAGLLLLERGTARPVWRDPVPAAVGGALFGAGLGLAAWAGYCLIRYGRGTPLPLDPPRRLVTRGPYRRVRNPQAIAMLLMAAGEVVAVRSAWLWVLVPATLAYLELLVGPWEGRQLARDFGPAHAAYVRRVRKWLPRWTAPAAEPAGAVPPREQDPVEGGHSTEGGGPMARCIVGVVCGLIVGAVFNMAVVMLSWAVYRPPEGADMSDPATMAAYVESLPVPAFLLILVAHAGGALAGGLVAAVVGRRAPLVLGAVVGGVFLLGGVVNAVSIPRPLWFAVADLVLYVPAGVAGARLASRRGPSDRAV